MTLGLDAEVADKLVAGLDAVFEEETVTHGVIGDIVLDQQIVCAVHGYAATVSVVNRRVSDVLPFCVTVQMPVDRVAGERQVLALISVPSNAPVGCVGKAIQKPT